jgi:hypothetical protein
MAIIEKNIARAIFEVKTSCSLSEQIYKGIGQLVSYKYFFGNSKTELFLVIPFAKNNKNQLPALMNNLGIHLIESKKSGFFLPNCEKLNEFLHKQKIV